MTSRAEIVEEAIRLSELLCTDWVQVKRSTWLSVLAEFMGTTHRGLSDLRGQLFGLLDALLAGKGGHLDRGENYAKQIRQTNNILRRVFADHDWDLTAFRQLFGWTARMLHVKERPADPRDPEPRNWPPKSREHCGKAQSSLKPDSMAELMRLHKKFKG